MAWKEEKEYIKRKSPADFFKRRNEECSNKHIRKCDYPGCCNEGKYRAPKNKENLNDYYWFCLDHVKDYNKSWNYYEGMSEVELELDRRKNAYGHRPTWNYTSKSAQDDLLKRVFNTFGVDGETSYSNESQKNSPQFQALLDLGLTPPITFKEIKKKYRVLVKKYHPDVNSSDDGLHDKIKKINAAYQLLKKAYNK